VKETCYRTPNLQDSSVKMICFIRELHTTLLVLAHLEYFCLVINSMEEIG